MLVGCLVVAVSARLGLDFGKHLCDSVTRFVPDSCVFPEKLHTGQRLQSQVFCKLTHDAARGDSFLMIHSEHGNDGNHGTFQDHLHPPPPISSHLMIQLLLSPPCLSDLMFSSHPPSIPKLSFAFFASCCCLKCSQYAF